MWGLFLEGRLMAKYDNYSDALQDMLNTYLEYGMKHEIKQVDKDMKEVSKGEKERLLK